MLLLEKNRKTEKTQGKTEIEPYLYEFVGWCGYSVNRDESVIFTDRFHESSKYQITD
jgi:hypothetical protein